MRRRIRVPPSVRRVMGVILDSGFEAYVVGGCVRDSLLGYEPADWDIATDAPPETVMEVFRGAGYRVVPTGIEYGTVTVIDGEGNAFEVTTYRREVYVEGMGRKPVVSWAASLREDVARRDFTINALAADVEGRVVDYVGGLRDIERRVIRFVGVPDERINEDPLRLLRALRFAAKLGFKIEGRSWEAIKRNAFKISEISRERVGEEFMKAARTPRFSLFIRLLKESGLHAYTVPELLPMMGVRHDSRGGHYGETVFEHTLDVLQRADSIGASPVVKLAALLHDVGKPHVARVENGRVTFHGHEVVGSRIARAVLLERLRYSAALAGRVAAIVRWHHLAYSYGDVDSKTLAKRMALKLRELAPDVLTLNYCDTGDARYLEATDTAREILSRSTARPLVTGRDIIEYYGVKPSPLVGVIKEVLYALQVQYELSTREEVLGKACELGIICRDGVERFRRMVKEIAGGIEDARRNIIELLDRLVPAGADRRRAVPRRNVEYA